MYLYENNGSQVEKHLIAVDFVDELSLYEKDFYNIYEYNKYLMADVNLIALKNLPKRAAPYENLFDQNSFQNCPKYMFVPLQFDETATGRYRIACDAINQFLTFKLEPLEKVSKANSLYGFY